MEKITDEVVGSVILVADKGMKITDRTRSFYASKLEIPAAHVDRYEEVYYDAVMQVELDEAPKEKALTEDQIKQINDIQNKLKELQGQLNDLLK